MSREVQVRFCESRAVRSRPATHRCLTVSGSRSDAEALKEKITGVLAAMGLRLSQDKTLITHIDQGLDFLGWRIQRRRKSGSNQHYVYTYPARKALRAVILKVKTVCRQVGTDQSLDALLHRLNPVLRSWCGYFRPGCPSRRSRIWAATRGFGYGTGCARNTPRPRGRPSATAIFAVDHGRAATVGCCSTRQRSAPAATGIGARPSRHPGRPPDNHHRKAPPGTCGEPLR